VSRPVVLRLEEDPGLPVDMTGVLPERLAGLNEAEVAAVPLQVGNRKLPLGELFRVTPGDAAHLVVEGATRRLDRLGAAMAGGAIEAYGDAGAYLGLGMRGGRIGLFGSAGDFAGAAMRDGAIVVGADAGDFVGGALPGDAHGMAGGAVLIGGDAGDRAGDRMRRGTIAVRGATGAYPASRMIGGTVVVGGACGAWPGYGMRRGTVALAHDPGGRLPAPLFADAGEHDLPWLALLDRHLRALGWEGGPVGRRVRRLAGDLSVGGRGEVLVAA
jgi:formylmethanofuran dehydrogenase subunit C